MNELQIFNNEEFGNVRSLMIDNEPWLVGKDVARALGYGEGKSLNNAVAKHVDDEDKGVTEMMTPGGKQNVTIINESGLYALVFGSKLPNDKRDGVVIHDSMGSEKKIGVQNVTPCVIDRDDKQLIQRSDLATIGNHLPTMNDLFTVNGTKRLPINESKIMQMLSYSQNRNVVKTQGQNAPELGQHGSWLINERGAAIWKN